MPSALLRARIRKARRRPFRRRRKRQREEQRHWGALVAAGRSPDVAAHAKQAQGSDADGTQRGTVARICAFPALNAKDNDTAGSRAPASCTRYPSSNDTEKPPEAAMTGALGRRRNSAVCWTNNEMERAPATGLGRRSVSFNSPFEWIRMDPVAGDGELVAKDWSRYLAGPRGVASRGGDALLSSGLERDDPEGRRVFAAMLRSRSSKTLTEPPSMQQSDKVLEWETATPGSTEVLPSRATWSGGQVTTEELEDSETQNREAAREVKDLQEASSGATTPERSREDVHTKGARSAPNGHGVGERFWAELEGLREENRLLRHENEVCRIQGSIHATKLRVCEVLSYVLYSTAFGFQSEQVDSSIQALVDDTGSWIASVVENILDKCVVLLRYVPGNSLDGGAGATAEGLCDVYSENESLAAKNCTQKPPLIEDEDVISSETFVLVTVSRALGHMTTMNQRWSHIDGSVSAFRWDGLFDIRGRRDFAELKKVQCWLREVFGGVRSPAGALFAAPGQRYPCDHLARLRLQSQPAQGATNAGGPDSFSPSSSCSFVYGGRGSAEDKILFVPFCLANRFYALGVHSARTDQVSETFIGRAASLPASRVRASSERVVSQNLSYEEEIVLRKESYKIVLRLAQGVLKLLSAAQMMLGRSNTILNTCSTLPPSPPVFSDRG